LTWLQISWVKKDVKLVATDGTIILDKKDQEFPEFWSEGSRNTVVDKYFRNDSKVVENSLKELGDRVIGTIAKWAVDDGYISNFSKKNFELNLKYIFYNQYAAFNSPVWFNVGVDEKPRISACFINSVEDNLESIMDLVKTEGFIFKEGSGAGSNLSSLRARDTKLSSGGYSSGPVSFMRGFDSFAGVIKSGGKKRRAAKMVMLDVDHLDILEFINSKKIEEDKARALIREGYSADFTNENGAYATVAFQNENHSVAITDEFMEAVYNDDYWYLINKVTGYKKRHKARDIFRAIAVAAHDCGDPGLFFISTANIMNTLKYSGIIRSTNPCGEYMSIGDSACNLASINVMHCSFPCCLDVYV